MNRPRIRQSFVVLLLSILVSCSNGGTKQFSPKEKQSKFSQNERDNRIAEKRQMLSEYNADSLLKSNGIVFSVLPPSVSECISVSTAERLAIKMIQIASQNDISGLCTNPVLAIAAKVNCIGRSITGTAPQKTIVKYEVTFYCGNLASNNIYGTCTQIVTGVGQNFTAAGMQAVNSVKNTSQVQDMLQTASNRALDWYSNKSNVKKIVDKAVSEQNYALAMAILSSVPEKSVDTYSYAIVRHEQVAALLFQQESASILAELENAICSAADEYNPAVGAYLKAIPVNSSSYTRAQAIYDEYAKRLRIVGDDQREQAYKIEMEEMALKKLEASYESQATLERIKSETRIGVAQADAEAAKNGNTGGFLGLGNLWKGGYDLINRIMDEALE